jgi:hypothetical protein
MSIGDECQVTPLQMLTLYNAVANDGKMMKPYLVEAITESGHIIESFRPQTIDKQIASEKTIGKAQELLEGVALRGTASKIPSPHVTFAGKTGTAVIDYYLPDDGRKNYQASFAGYFPMENPRYSCIVLINDPLGGRYYGSSVALPVFIEIAEQCVALDPVEFDLQDVQDSTGRPHAMQTSWRKKSNGTVVPCPPRTGWRSIKLTNSCSQKGQYRISSCLMCGEWVFAMHSFSWKMQD